MAASSEFNSHLICEKLDRTPPSCPLRETETMAYLRMRGLFIRFLASPLSRRGRAAIARKPGEPLVIEEVIVAPPKVHEVRLKIICTSLCHSDVTFWKLKDFPGCFPRILGHEAFGVVESVGEDVHNLKRGHSVVPIFLPDCAQCILYNAHRRRKTLVQHMLRDGTSRFTTVDGETLYHFL